MNRFGFIFLSILVFSVVGIHHVYAEETEVIIGKTFDETRIYKDSSRTEYTAFWKSAQERILDNGIYVDFKVRDEGDKIYFESANANYSFDKTTNTINILSNDTIESKLYHVIKEARNGTDIWNDFVIDGQYVTAWTKDKQGMQIISKKGEYQVIYDITRNGFEYTYKYKNNDFTKTDHKYGFTSICEGKCSDIKINNVPVQVGQTKVKDQLVKKDIRLGGNQFDLKESEHGYTWAMKKIESNKMVIDFTDSKGRLDVGQTLIVDPVFSSTPSSENSNVAADTTPAQCNGKSVTGTSGSVRASADATICRIPYMVFPTAASISPLALVTNATLTYDVTSTSFTGTGCYPFSYTTTPGANQATYDAVFTASGLATMNADCKSTADNYVFVFNSTGLAFVQSKVVSGVDVGLGIWFSPEPSGQDVTLRSADATLAVTYTTRVANPGPPTSPSGAGLPYANNFTWNMSNATAVTGTAVWVSSNNSTFSWLANVANGTTYYVHEGLGVADTRYYKASHFSYNNGTNSTTAAITTDNYPDAPTITSFVPSTSHIDILRTAGASDGGDVVTNFDLRCEIDNTGGWQAIVTNATIANFYNYTGVAEITCQWRDRNGVGYSAWSGNTTSSTYVDISATMDLELGNVGDVVNATGVLTISDSNPLPVSVSLLELIVNGTVVETATPGGSYGIETASLDPLWWLIPDDDLRAYYLNATLTNGHDTTEIQSNTVNLTREFLPEYFEALDPTQGFVNRTITRTADQDTIFLTVNRDKSGATFQVECRYRSMTDAALGGAGTWHNYTNVGYMNDTFNNAEGTHYYIDCYNDGLLFNVISYTNSSMLLAGIEVFDDTYGTFIGVPVGVFFIVLVAGMANQRTAPMWIVVILAIAGIMSAIGFFTLETNVWALALIAALLGIIVGRKLF